MKKRIAALLLALFLALGLAAGCTSEEARQALELAQSLEEALQEQSGPVTQAEAQPASLQNEPGKRRNRLIRKPLYSMGRVTIPKKR